MKLEEIPPRNSKRSFLKSNQHALKTSHHHHHLSLNREGRWDTTDDFGTSFFHFSLFSTALLDLANSRPVHSLMLSSHLFLCLPCLHPPFTVPRKMVLARPDERETSALSILLCVKFRAGEKAGRKALETKGGVAGV